jgi:hypothetical protein
MSSKLPKPQFRQGSADPAEIYLSVGVALSWWEASEDVLESLFGHVCGLAEPVAAETFEIAPRVSRTKMIASALRRYGHATKDEAQAILAALKALDRLAETRNQIAHGHVSHLNHSEDGHLTMSGNFLVSTVSPTGEVGRRKGNLKYALTATEIDQWREQVRYHRGILMDVEIAIFHRLPDDAKVMISKQNFNT